VHIQPAIEPAPVLAEFTRGSIVESRFRGQIVAVNGRGELLGCIGDPGHVAYFRSAAKPFQALPLIESGAADHFGFTSEEIALACASHNASLWHQHIARSMLRKIGLPEDALQCGFAEPLDKLASSRLELGLDERSPVHCECSGKHAGMLAVCAREGWPIDTYLDPDHPLQQRILGHLSEATGVAADRFVIGIDGCGLPTFGASLRDFALAYSVLARDAMPGLHRVRTAMTAHPDAIAGAGEVDSDVMRLTHGSVVAKLGAEGLVCLALPESGIGIAILIEAGVERAHGPVVVHALAQLDALDSSVISALRERFSNVITNFEGKEVGVIRTPFSLN
jgi:L-asparaginase II